MHEDKLILGGHTFTSRFILGSGKYSLPLIRAAAEQAGAQIITLALRRAQSQQDNILDFIPEGITLLPIPPVPVTLKKQYASPGWPAPAAAAILSSWRSSAILNICCRIIRRRSGPRTF